MPRYAFRIEYDGRPFSGWQRQAAHPSVQGALEAALARIAPEAPQTVGAGRTDAGVHAAGAGGARRTWRAPGSPGGWRRR